MDWVSGAEGERPAAMRSALGPGRTGIVQESVRARKRFAGAVLRPNCQRGGLAAWGWPDDGSAGEAEGTGSGLGLALSRNIVEGLGGSIVIDSRIDVGTTVHIELPDKH